MSKIKISLFCLFVLGTRIAVAQSELTDEMVNQAAMKETQDQILDPSKRIEIIKVSPQGKNVDAQVKELMGQNSENMYKTASDFLPYILKMGQGDPTKMAEYLGKALRNPASFANELPPDLQQKVRDLGQQVKPLPEQRKP